jgi:hypothetical protein
VVRFNFILTAAIGFVTALMLTTCASPSRVVWEYYDQCARENPSFLAMAECGKQKRLAECVPNNACSPEGNMFMEHIDTLGSRLIKSTIPGRLQDRRTPSSFGPTYRIVWRCA